MTIEEIAEKYKEYRECGVHTQRMRLQAQLVDEIPFLLKEIELEYEWVDIYD